MKIFDYAKVSEWEARLRNLAEFAEPERWTNTAVPSESPLPVLDSYIKYTFMRAYEQRRVFENEKFSCFNTGLLTPSQEEIFGVFKRNDNYIDSNRTGSQGKKWYLTSWTRAGDRQLTDFMSLPPLVTYWEDPSDLIFNPVLKVQLNLDHIIRENIKRFPLELGDCLDDRGIPGDIVYFPDIEDDNQEYLSEISTGASVIPLNTRNALEGAMKHSIRLAERSYRIAVPQFYHGRIQLLFPLYLRNTSKPDLVLTLERNGDWYRAATILYPDWAYRHARLLARPNSEWLGGFVTNLDSMT